MNPSNETGGGQAPDPGQVPGAQPMPQPPAPQPPQMPPTPGQPAPDAANAPMTFPLPPSAPQSPQAPAQNAQQPAPMAPQTDVQPTTQPAMPPVVDDGDLIEKEWVSKAKEIVDRNRNDPHKQSEEMNKFRADYMKKQYNKDIKLDT